MRAHRPRLPTCRHLSLLLVTSVLAILGPAAPALAQGAGGTGTVRGTVSSEEGEPAPFAEVSVVGTRLGTLTDESGHYAITDVPAGQRLIRARRLGFKPDSATVTVPAGGSVEQDFTLATDRLSMEAIVVTGTRTPQTKLLSSNAITTLNSEEVAQKEARSTADLLKAVPGFYVESSGGNVGNNLFVRGLPADGSYRYVALMENGMPVYDATELSFVNADIFVRTDQSLDHIEAVRGGNSALYGGNAPGGVVNFISKTGGPELSGTMKASLGTGGLARYDLNVGGPIAEDWRFDVGGFYRYDNGTRYAGFPGSKGGQIEANVTRLLDNGYIRLYGRYLNDRNIFYLPTPFAGDFSQDGSLQSFDYVQGFPSNGTMTTDEGVDVRVPLPRGNGDLVLPLDDGQHQNGAFGMAELNLGLPGDWTLKDKLRVMSVHHTWNALLPNDLRSADTWAQGFVDATPGGASFQLLCTNVRDAGGAKVPFGSAACPDPNGLVGLDGEWHVDLPMSDVSNQLEVTRHIESGDVGHDLTLGGYFGHYTADNTWYFNDILTSVQARPHFLDLRILDAGGNVIRQVTADGFRQYLSLYVNGTGNVNVAALFGGDQMQLGDRVRLDLGVRYEHNDYQQDDENTSTFDLGGPTDADNAVPFGNGTFSRVEVHFDDWAASVGLNYSLSDRATLYGRVSRGYKMPILSNFLFATDPTDPSFPNVAETLWQGEGGLKFGSPHLGLSAVGYWLQLENFPSQDVRITPGGQTEFITDFVGKSRTFGAELEAVAQPVQGLSLNLSATAQRPTYTNFVAGGDTLDGNRVRRIPEIFGNLDAAYEVRGFRVRGAWHFTGHRFADDANQVDLPAFSVFDAGLSYRLRQGVRVDLNALNLADGHGVTEGNPRLDQTVGRTSNIFLARPILPRRFTLGVTYEF